VGDIFNWFVNYIQPAGQEGRLARGAQTQAAEARARGIRPAGPGLEQRQPHHPGGPAPDRPAVGQTLYTTPAEIYRALIEATAFGALTIINRFEEYGVKVGTDRQLRRHRGEKPAGHADLRRRHRPADEDLPLGADLRAGRGHRGGGGRRARIPILPSAQKGDDRFEAAVYKPNPKAHAVYRELYPLYKSCTTPSARRLGAATCTA
jgi:L-ribulokinase